MIPFPADAFVKSPFWDEDAYAQAHRQAIPVSIRTNPLKPSSVISLQPVPWCSGAYYLPERPSFTLDPLFHAGAYYVQEASSMLLYQAVKQHVPEKSGLKVLDLCAAPGGKSTLLAGLLKSEDLLISNEIIGTRANILVENMTRWGQINTWVSNNEPKDFGRLPGFFDLIVIDAPCSGSGMWRKDEQAITEWSEKNVELCKERQEKILRDTLVSLKKEGILVYSTCSFSIEENEEIVDFLIQEMQMESLALDHDPAWGLTETFSPQKNGLGYRAYPWKMQGEGFFIAVFKKKDGVVNEQLWGSSAKPSASETKKETEAKTAFTPFLAAPFEMISHQETFYALHPAHKALWPSLKSSLYIKKAGTALGQMLKGVIPEHDLAMSVHLHPEIPRVNLDKNEALHYLKKESVASNLGLKGWQVACVEGLSLGWGKWMVNRMNNYLPKNLRIRMDLKG